jgi:hypothetical protein
VNEKESVGEIMKKAAPVTIPPDVFFAHPTEIPAVIAVNGGGIMV